MQRHTMTEIVNHSRSTALERRLFLCNRYMSCSNDDLPSLMNKINTNHPNRVSNTHRTFVLISATWLWKFNFNCLPLYILWLLNCILSVFPFGVWGLMWIWFYQFMSSLIYFVNARKQMYIIYVSLLYIPYPSFLYSSTNLIFSNSNRPLSLSDNQAHQMGLLTLEARCDKWRRSISIATAWDQTRAACVTDQKSSASLWKEKYMLAMILALSFVK